jgi:hypothetical protein
MRDPFSVNQVLKPAMNLLKAASMSHWYPSSELIFAVPGIVTGIFALRLTAADFHHRSFRDVTSAAWCCRCSSNFVLAQDNKRGRDRSEVHARHEKGRQVLK